MIFRFDGVNKITSPPPRYLLRPLTLSSFQRENFHLITIFSCSLFLFISINMLHVFVSCGEWLLGANGRKFVVDEEKRGRLIALELNTTLHELKTMVSLKKSYVQLCVTFTPTIHIQKNKLNIDLNDHAYNSNAADNVIPVEARNQVKHDITDALKISYIIYINRRALRSLSVITRMIFRFLMK